MKGYRKDPVGAHSGFRPWLLQRLTAVVMGAYTIVLMGCLLWRPPASQEDLRAMFSGGFFRVATMLFLVALLYHAWVGLRDILLDYVKPVWVRVAAQLVIGQVLTGYLIWGAAILWGAR